MRKKRNFFTISTINAKQVSSFLSSAVIFVLLISTSVLFAAGNINSGFIISILQSGSRLPHTMPPINIVKVLMQVSSPSMSITPIPKITKDDNLQPTEISVSPELPTSPPAVPENNAQSITYESAEEKGYKSIGGIYINNQTSKNVDIQSLLDKQLDMTLSSDPSVLILHTHATESYTPSQQYNYTPTETDRTTDTDFNMVSVGEVIFNTLTENGINVIHDKTLNDYPSYSKSYSNSLALVNSYIKKYPSIKIVIDVHRDAMVTKDGKKIRPIASTDSPCAQLMLVIGTDDSGLQHSLWQTNLSFAVKLQAKMNSMYPTLARPINLRRQRFNQHAAPFAFILEVGTNGNTLDEAKEAALLFSKSLISLLQN